MLAQAHAWAAAVFVDEFDAGGLQGASNHIESRAARLAEFGLQLMHCHDANGGMGGKILLAPIKESACGPTLC